MAFWIWTIQFFLFADSANKGINASGGKAADKKIYAHEKIEQNNKNAHKYIQTYEDFKASQSQQLSEAAKATVQIIPKCQVAIEGNGYYIGQQNALGFCEGHPLAKYGVPTPYKTSEDEPLTLARSESEARRPCSSRPCSGALIESQQTIGTVGHCMQGLSTKDFCQQFVFVFGRSGAKTSFSKDEVVECDDGVSLDTGGASADFNFHADHLTKDHAVLHLKNPVSLSTAKALEVRDSAAKKDEKLFAVGHPYGQPRMVSPLTVSFVKNGAGYSYIHSQGYVYGGNSGGPLLDAEGKVVGMMVATDDKKYGPPQKREPLVTDEKTGMTCRTQDASSTIETEAVGFGTEIRKALEGQASPAAAIRTEGEEGAYR